MEPRIYLFDMDHTLIDNDCDVSWKEFLIERGLAPSDSRETAARFYRDYAEDRLDVEEFMAFQLAEFQGRTVDEMEGLAQQHFDAYAKPKLYRDAVAMVESVRDGGHPLALLTATNAVVARPLAEHLGIPRLLAVRPRLIDGLYTGGFVPPYSGGPGKVPLAKAFCREFRAGLKEAAYFGDSLADLPLLKEAGFPHVVNPGGRLRKIAARNSWPILQWT